MGTEVNTEDLLLFVRIDGKLYHAKSEAEIFEDSNNKDNVTVEFKFDKNILVYQNPLCLIKDA